MTGFRTADAALIVLGFSDTLLMTSPSRWERDLARVVTSFRHAAGPECGVVITGLAPMDEFHYTARLGRRRIHNQVERLNHGAEQVAARLSHCVFVPPPLFEHTRGRPGDEQYSWALIHQLWSQAISDALFTVLSDASS